jgi:soluble lytic murein transglycosylase-like protein
MPLGNHRPEWASAGGRTAANLSAAVPSFHQPASSHVIVADRGRAAPTGCALVDPELEQIAWRCPGVEAIEDTWDFSLSGLQLQDLEL